jgi:hypothetical protein
VLTNSDVKAFITSMNDAEVKSILEHATKDKTHANGVAPNVQIRPKAGIKKETKNLAPSMNKKTK